MFWRGGENWRSQRKNSWRKDKNQWQNSTHKLWSKVRESNQGHIVGRQVLSPLCHPRCPQHCQHCSERFYFLWACKALEILSCMTPSHHQQNYCQIARQKLPQKDVKTTTLAYLRNFKSISSVFTGPFCTLKNSVHSVCDPNLMTNNKQIT